MPTPPGANVGSPLLNTAIFGVFILITLFIVFRAARSNRTAADYYTGNASIDGTQNGIALAGDYLSAAAFLGIAGGVAVYGYDGASYAFGNMVGWIIALLWVAEPSRNTGRFTMGDIVDFRPHRRQVRLAAAASTLLISILYMVAQISGAGGLIALLLGIPNTNPAGQGAAIAAVGLLMIAYVLIGGMKGTTWVQIIKAGLLIVVAVVLSAWVIGSFGYNLSDLLGAAAAANPAGDRILAPGLIYAGPLSGLDQLSAAFAGLAGPASLPHILMRFNTVADGRQVRKSVVWAIWLVGLFFVMVIVIGFGAGALVGPQAIAAAPGATNAAIPLLAYRIGGELLLGLVAAVAFATILAVVAGLTITASASFAHDIYAGRRRGGRGGRRHPGQRAEHRVPGDPGVRHRHRGQPAQPDLLRVLEAVQHDRAAVEHVGRADHLDRARHVLPRGLRQPHRDAALAALQLVPADQPGDRGRPAVVRAGRAGHAARRAQPRRRQPVRRDGGARHHRGAAPAGARPGRAPGRRRTGQLGAGPAPVRAARASSRSCG
jgi:cation/acetate symporter